MSAPGDAPRRCPRCVRIEAATSVYRQSAERREDRPYLASERHHVGFELERCPVCHGTFLDAGELEALENAGDRRARSDPAQRAGLVRRALSQGRRPEDVAAEAERTPLDCPACDGPMLEREWGIGTMVRVDVCLECRGVWLDEGELETLAGLYGSTRRGPS